MDRTITHTEEELLQQLYAGSQQAFTQIYNLYWDKLYFLAHKHTKSAEASEELVQEVFLNIWRKKDSILIENLPAYLASMTRYEVYRYLAKQKRQTLAKPQMIEEKQLSINQADHIDHKILLEIIEKLSHRLPEKCRLVFIHNKLLDKPLDVVAAEMSISAKTAEAHLTKALKLIRGNIRKAFTFFYNFLIFF